MFWLSWAQGYSIVERPHLCLLHCCGITLLILPSQETYSEETKAMLLHSPGDVITDVEQFFSITIIFKSMSFSVFRVAWPNETVLQSKLRCPLLSTLDKSQKHFIVSAVIFGRKWLAQLVSQTPEQRPPPTSLVLFVYDFGQVSSSFDVIRKIK